MFENYELEILYKDEYLVAINKPSGLLVHKSMIDRHEIYFAMKMLRDQIGAWVYPIHRLDKPTSGVLLFALDSHTAKLMSEQFKRHSIEKTYIAIGRGYVAQEAVTAFRCLGQVEIDASVGRYDTVRYSLVELKPRTDRKHQLRRHMKHINHHLLGDTKYGRGEHNIFVREKYDMYRLLLHAISLKIMHPYTHKELCIKAPLDEVFTRILEEFHFSSLV